MSLGRYSNALNPNGRYFSKTCMLANCTQLDRTKWSRFGVHGVHTYSFEVSEFGSNSAIGKKVINVQSFFPSRDAFLGVTPFGKYPIAESLATRVKKVHYDVFEPCPKFGSDCSIQFLAILKIGWALGAF